jgi:membrane associated rhomboid family serine protease
MANHNTLGRCIRIASAFAALLWGIKLFESITGIQLSGLGVYPRHLDGLPGVLSAPLIHGSWEHLIGNSLPLILLGSMLLYGYPKSRYWALAGIWLLSGMGVWLFARGSTHFGASGIAHGMFFYLFVGGILRRDKRSAVLLMVAFYMYGGMLLSILPTDPGISFESHLFGAIAGGLLAYVFRNWDPKPQRKRYAWEREPGSEEPLYEDPVIGDQWQIESSPEPQEQTTLHD